jgi:hypothetical protein
MCLKEISGRNKKTAARPLRSFYNFRRQYYWKSQTKKINEFEESLKETDLWNVAILELPFKERKPYLEFMEKFEELRNMFAINISFVHLL